VPKLKAKQEFKVPTIPQIKPSLASRYQKELFEDSLFTLPPLGSGLDGYGQFNLKKLYKQPRIKTPKYTASLNAAAFNIAQKATEKQLKQLQKYEFTGFETRPLLDITDLVPTKRKKKRK
jgi:hypothetical protein